jgi:hypothetical protein
MALSVVPSPDVNMTLVSSESMGVIARVLERVTDAGVPCLFMLSADSVQFDG